MIRKNLKSLMNINNNNLPQRNAESTCVQYLSTSIFPANLRCKLNIYNFSVEEDTEQQSPESSNPEPSDEEKEVRKAAIRAKIRWVQVCFIFDNSWNITEMLCWMRLPVELSPRQQMEELLESLILQKILILILPTRWLYTN